MSRSRWVPAALVLLVLVGTFLRLWHLDWQCLASDEAWTADIVRLNDLAGIIPYSFGYNYNPPTFFLFAKLSALIFGNTIFAIRLPSAILGILAILLCFIVGREFRGDFSGLLLAAFIAISYPFVYYSQNARAYMLVFCAFLLFTYFFIRVWRGDRSPRVMGLLVAAGVLCLLSHYYAIIPLVVAMGLILWKTRSGALLVALVACCGALSLVLMPVVIAHFHSLPTAVHNIFWLSASDVGTMLPTELFGWACVLIIPLIGFSLWMNYDDGLLLALTAIGGVTVASCLPMTLITAMSPRYALLVSPLLVMVAMAPIADYAEQLGLYRKMILFAWVTYLIGIFAYGALLSWTTFNVCRFV